MIIHQPEININDNEVVVSARVETSAKVSIPKELWFKFPAEYQDAVSDRTESFFSTLFLLGMHLNEDVEIRGEVSPLLAKNIHSLADKFLQVRKKHIHRINYDFKSLKISDTNITRDIRLSSFSAGADSFYAFWSHHFPKKSQHPTNLTHGLFIHGFDIFLQNGEYYQNLFSEYRTQFTKWGLSLIKCSTNAYSFYQFRVPWEYAHIPTLAGVAMVLGNRVSNYIQPGNLVTDLSQPGSESAWVHLLSTESTQISAHAEELTRLKKLEQMIDWLPLQNHLRACLRMNNTMGKKVCDRCEKCLTTSLIIQIFDKKEYFKTYDKKFTLANFIYLCWISVDLVGFKERGFLEIHKGKKRFDFIMIYWIMFPINFLRLFLLKNIIPLTPKPILYKIKNLVFPKQKL